MKELRRNKGLTQSQLAKRLYVSQMLVSYWEQGIREPSCSMIIRLANALDCSVEQIVRCFV